MLYGTVSVILEGEGFSGHYLLGENPPMLKSLGARLREMEVAEMVARALGAVGVRAAPYTFILEPARLHAQAGVFALRVDLARASTLEEAEKRLHYPFSPEAPWDYLLLLEGLLEAEGSRLLQEHPQGGTWRGLGPLARALEEPEGYVRAVAAAARMDPKAVWKRLAALKELPNPVLGAA